MIQRYLDTAQQSHETSGGTFCSANISPACEATDELASEETIVTESTEDFSSLLHMDARSRRRAVINTLSGAGVAMLTVFAFSMWAYHDSNLTLSQKIESSIVLPVCVAIIVMAFSFQFRMERRKIARLVKKQTGVRLIASLIETFNSGDCFTNQQVTIALARLLPQLKASDSNLLTEAHRTTLLNRLATPPDQIIYYDVQNVFSPSTFRREVDFRLAILKAMEQIGGAKEFPVVLKLAEASPRRRDPDGRLQEIVEAAKQCLPYIQMRAAKQQASEQLLRASSYHTTAPNILLRPVASYNDSRDEAASEHLLRAVDSGNSSSKMLDRD